MCNKNYLLYLQEKILNNIWEHKRNFTSEDDYDAACSCVEEIFDKELQKKEIK